MHVCLPSMTWHFLATALITCGYFVVSETATDQASVIDVANSLCLSS
jgi:hypothetical protein